VNQRLIAADVFSGAGGFSLGAEQAGFDPVVSVEADEIHSRTHTYNFPLTSHLCIDVRKVTGSLLRAQAAGAARRFGHERARDLDLLIGGPPCQGFSTVGRRDLADQRNDLIQHFARLVVEAQPRYFVMENVPGLLLGPTLSLLHRVMDTLISAGYNLGTGPVLLHSANFGVPQDRLRMFLVGARTGESYPDIPSPTHSPRFVLRKRRSLVIDNRLPGTPTVADAIYDLALLSEWGLTNQDDTRLNAKAAHVHRLAMSKYAQQMRTAGQVDLSWTRDWDAASFANIRVPHHSEQVVSRFDVLRHGAEDPSSRLRRLHPDGLSATLRSGSAKDHGGYTAPRPIHPTLPRVISVREAARLHSFPDWFLFNMTSWHGFRQIGNAVPPRMAAAIMRQIAHVAGGATAPNTPALPSSEKRLLESRNRAA
jgi:DNA (cytosine-5)-methyltransferase 1